MAPIQLRDVAEEYKKYPELDPEDVRHLMEWIQKQPHLPKISELQMIMFFHSCEFKIEYTKTVIDLNYTMRTLVKNIFEYRDVLDKKVQHTLNSVLVTPLPKLTPIGHKVFYCRLLDYDPKNFVFDQSAKLFTLVFELLQWEEGTWPAGAIIIDCDRVAFGHLAKLDILTVKQVLLYLQEAMTCRLGAFHFMNAPSFMDKIMALLKPFIKKDLMNMLHIHSAPNTSLYNHVPKDILPVEAGGEWDMPFKKLQEKERARLTENRQILIEEEKLRVIEAARPGKPKDMGSIFGVEGSFKKLDID